MKISVIGSSSKRAIYHIQKTYKPFLCSWYSIIVMDEKYVESTKYAANSFLVMKTTFMNEIANFCEKAGADVDKILAEMGSDSRIDRHFLFPEIGCGGSCIPKDVKALSKSGKDKDYNFSTLDAVFSR